MMTFAICDDEPLMAQELAERLGEYLTRRRVGDCRVSRFSSGRALLESGERFDVIFLDIRMEAPGGMETAEILRRRGDRSLVIFVTVLRECVFDAFQVEAWDYLVKPLDGRRFRCAMDRALRALERRRAGTIVVRRGSGCEVVPLEEILYCEVQGRKLYLHQRGGGTADYYGRLELERRVDGRFFKCHRSYLVNLDYVRRLQDGQVTLSQGEAVPVSRLRERELAQALLRWMEEREL